MGSSLGLLGGAGQLPGLMAREARTLGWRVVAFALADPTVLTGVADRVVPCRVGELGPVLDTLREEEIRHLVLAGRVWKDRLFRGMAFDERFFLEFDHMRPHQVRLEGGDASSDSFCYA